MASDMHCVPGVLSTLVHLILTETFPAGAIPTPLQQGNQAAERVVSLLGAAGLDCVLPTEPPSTTLSPKS